MDRRWGGIVLLIAAVAAAVVLGSLHTKQVGGTAATAPPPGPPAVGDCLGVLAGYGYPFAATVVACEQAHVGEVVDVMSDGALSHATSPADSTDDETDPSIACELAAVRYMGVPDGSTWYPAATFGSYLIQPDPIAQQLGSQWLVCAVGASAADLGQGAYDGTLRDAAAGGRYPSSFAVCPLSFDNISMAQSCTSPHRLESFGTTFVGDTGRLPELTASCASWVATLTGLADPTAGGRLTAALVPTDASSSTEPATEEGAPTDQVEPGGAVYTCVVHTTGSHELTGPLLGLRGEPVPVR